MSLNKTIPINLTFSLLMSYIYRMTDGNRTFFKWTVLTWFSTKQSFCNTKLYRITCHLKCILRMKDNARQVVSTSFNAHFQPLQKRGVCAVQHLTINCCHSLLDCLLQIGQGAGLVSVDTSCKDEMPNIFSILCALIHDLSLIHARVFVQTAEGS
jgi:hypothetical protein